MKIEMIVAKAKNNVIGKDNTLIWDIPEDLAHFKKITMGKTIVMGSNTYESIGRPLPGRQNVVLTRNSSKYKNHNVKTVSSAQEILDLSKETQIVIIGGDSVYKIFLEYASILYVTDVEKEFDGDSYFPTISSEWELTSSNEGEKSSENLKYFFKKYEKSDIY